MQNPKKQTCRHDVKIIVNVCFATLSTLPRKTHTLQSSEFYVNARQLTVYGSYNENRNSLLGWPMGSYNIRLRYFDWLMLSKKGGALPSHPTNTNIAL